MDWLGDIRIGECGGHQKGHPSVTHRRPIDRTQGVCCRTYGSTTPMPIARLRRRSVNDAGTLPPVPLRINGLLLVSLLLFSISTTHSRLVRSWPHPVSNNQQSRAFRGSPFSRRGGRFGCSSPSVGSRNGYSDFHRGLYAEFHRDLQESAIKLSSSVRPASNRGPPSRD